MFLQQGGAGWVNNGRRGQARWLGLTAAEEAKVGWGEGGAGPSGRVQSKGQADSVFDVTSAALLELPSKKRCKHGADVRMPNLAKQNVSVPRKQNLHRTTGVPKRVRGLARWNFVCLEERARIRAGVQP